MTGRDGFNASIILASASPRRREMLARIIPDFQVVPADIPEDVEPGIKPEELAEDLAFRKADSVLRSHPGALVIGADTVVALGDQVLGKPADRDEAIKMLKTLSGQEHLVVTGVAVCYRTGNMLFHEKTWVRFRHLDQDEIHRYVETGEPMDKAGAYGIQGLGSLFVEKINGDYLNVVGFPLGTFRARLRSAGWADRLTF